MRTIPPSGAERANDSSRCGGSVLTRMGPLLVVGAMLWSLSFSLFNISHSIWLDESHTYLISCPDTVREVVDRTVKYRPYPPLYFLTVNQALKWGDGEVALRIPSVFFGVATVLFLFLVGRLLQGASVGALAAWLFAMTPGVLRHFVDANAYTMLACFSTAASYFLLKAIIENKRWTWIGYGLSSVFALGTHTFGLFLVLSHFACALWLFVRSNDRADATCAQHSVWPATRALRPFVLSATVVVTCWAAWVCYYISHGGVAEPIALGRLFSPGTVFFFGTALYGFFFKAPIQALLLPLLQFSGAVGALRRDRRTFVLILFMLLGPIVPIVISSRITLTFVAYKYAAGALPFSCILAASCLHWAWSWNGHWGRQGARAAKTLTSLAIASYLLAGAVWLFTPSQGPRFRFQDWRGAADYIRSQASPTDLLVFHPDYGALPFNYYYRKHHTRIGVSSAHSPERVADTVAEFVHTLDSTAKVWVVSGFQEGTDNPLTRLWPGRSGYANAKAPSAIAQQRANDLRTAIETRFPGAHASTRIFQRVFVTSFSLPPTESDKGSVSVPPDMYGDTPVETGQGCHGLNRDRRARNTASSSDERGACVIVEFAGMPPRHVLTRDDRGRIGAFCRQGSLVKLLIDEGGPISGPASPCPAPPS